MSCCLALKYEPAYNIKRESMSLIQSWGGERKIRNKKKYGSLFQHPTCLKYKGKCCIPHPPLYVQYSLYMTFLLFVDHQILMNSYCKKVCSVQWYTSDLNLKIDPFRPSQSVQACSEFRRQFSG